jgi:hypothetical protein
MKHEENRTFLSIYHPPLDKKYLVEQVTQKLYHIFHGNKLKLFSVWKEISRKLCIPRRNYEISDGEDGKDCGGKI